MYAFAIGFVFAYMVEATGSLWPSVIAHFAINTYSIGVVQLLKMAGMYTADGQAAEVLEGEGELAASAGTMATVIQLVIFAAIAAAFMMLTVLCIKTMAKRAKKYLSAPVVLGLAVCICYMITIEFAFK